MMPKIPPPPTEVQGRAAAWAESEVQRLSFLAKQATNATTMDVTCEHVRAALETSFRVGYEAGRVDEERAQRTRPRK